MASFSQEGATLTECTLGGDSVAPPEAPDIDGVALDPDRLMVHGINLLDLIGTLSFPGAVFHVLAGRSPTGEELVSLDTCLCNFLTRAIDAEDLPLLTALSARQPQPERYCIAGLALMGNAAPIDKGLPTVLDALAQREMAAALRAFTAIPALLSLLLGRAPEAQGRQKDAKSFSAEVLMRLRVGDEAPANHVALFDVLLVALHGGFGFVAPTILLPRFSATTHASIDLNLIAGIAGSGPMHVGACNEAVRFFSDLKTCTQQQVREQVHARLQSGRKIPGFGHPLLDVDPRPAALEHQVAKLQAAGPAFEVYRAVSEIMAAEFALLPNVDAAAAAILLDLGVPEAFGTSLFLFARMPTMIAHALQKKSKPAFGQKRMDAREKLERIPKTWV